MLCEEIHYNNNLKELTPIPKLYTKYLYYIPAERDYILRILCRRVQG